MIKKLLYGGINASVYKNKLYFGSTSRFERKLEDPKYKDYSKSVIYHGTRELVKNKLENKYDIDNIRALSKAETTKGKMKHFLSEKESVNQSFKKVANWKIEQTGMKLLEHESVHKSLRLIGDNADQLNKIRAAEWEIFKKKMFEKNEIKRLLEKEERSVDRAIRSNQYPKANPFLEQIFDDIQIKQNQSYKKTDIQHFSNKGNNEQDDRYDQYKETINHLKNSKTEDIMLGGQASEKLKDLLEAG